MRVSVEKIGHICCVQTITNNRSLGSTPKRLAKHSKQTTINTQFSYPTLRTDVTPEVSIHKTTQIANREGVNLP